MSEVQTFLYLRAVNPSNTESRLESCLILNTDLKTGVRCVNEFLRIGHIHK